MVFSVADLKMSSRKSKRIPSMIGPLTEQHFDIAFKEVPASLTDDTLTLAELKKWDDSFGENASRKKKTKGWGFSSIQKEESKTTTLSE